MSDTKFTPGPYKAEWTPSTRYEDEEILVIIMTNGHMDGETVIARVDDYTWADYPNARSIAEANAHLLAAAPELYAALELCIAVLDRSQPPPSFINIDGAFFTAQAALAKARGEA